MGLSMLEFNDISGFRVSKSDEPDKRIIMAVVYQPSVPDSDNEFMDSESVEKMAHDFLGSGKVNQIDTQHGNALVQGARVIESFIARKGDQDFVEGSWVVAMKIDNDLMWSKIKKGEINGFSIEALVTKTPMVMELDIPPVVKGKTTKSEDHEHDFFVTFDNDGKFLGGRTNVEKGHFHNIRAGTVTESEQNHNHRFSFVENAYTNPIQLAAVVKSAAECGVYPHKVEEMQVIASVETVNPTESAESTEVVKADFPLANKEGANTSNPEDNDNFKPKKKFKLAVKEAVSEVIKDMGLEVIEKGGVGSGRRNKSAASGAWVVHNTDTGELHAVHPSYGKAMNHTDALNNEHLNDTNTKPDKYGMIAGKYGAMAKSTWDASHPVTKEE